MTRRISYGAILVMVWIALWQDFTWANALSGTIVAITLMLVFQPQQERAAWPLRPLWSARFLGYFFWKLVEASAVVAWEVVTPRNRITEGIIAVRIRGVSDGLTTVVANAISLTPGTLTIEASRDPAVLYVHVLHLENRERLTKEILRLEAHAIRAFGPPDAVEAVINEGADEVPSGRSQAAEAVTTNPEEGSS